RLGCPQAAITAPVPGRFGRYVFAVPWHNGLVMIGLTDDPHRGPIPERAHPDDVEEMFLLGTINAVLDDELTPEDIVGGYAGFRPLIRSTGASKSTGASGSADLSRKHALLRDSRTGALTIVGGKLTLYRRMAEDAVDDVVPTCGLPAGPCRTSERRLVGKGTPPPGLPQHLRAPGGPRRHRCRDGGSLRRRRSLTQRTRAAGNPTDGRGSPLRRRARARPHGRGRHRPADPLGTRRRRSRRSP